MDGQRTKPEVALAVVVALVLVVALLVVPRACRKRAATQAPEAPAAAPEAPAAAPPQSATEERMSDPVYLAQLDALNDRLRALATARQALFRQMEQRLVELREGSPEWAAAAAEERPDVLRKLSEADPRWQELSRQADAVDTASGELQQDARQTIGERMRRQAAAARTGAVPEARVPGPPR